MSSQDYIKYLVQQMVKYMDMPKEKRKEVRELRKEQRPRWSHRWFGMVPFGMKMFAKRQKNRFLRSQP
ncbi:YqzE family protein [Paludifilum halophilum]|uniref:YqzE family protein n=1 Tax=Paludifilum halophilum TaxID=1642702 RepID=A0A235B6C1_9BACL|nr:YqzE family protein [Paludifilum halophilum]OYD07781.1 YqzE family protein [Paludifilum halophilum]